MNDKYVVYWMSDFVGTPSSAPLTQPNALMFPDEPKARAHRAKLLKLMYDSGTYRGRRVTHVSEVQVPDIDGPFEMLLKKRDFCGLCKKPKNTCGCAPTDDGPDQLPKEPEQGPIPKTVSAMVDYYERSQKRLKDNSRFTADELIGKLARADHPITCLNPTEWFTVVAAQEVSGRLSVRGAETCWFGLNMVEIKE